MNLPGSIKSAELKFKQILEDFFISIYDDNSLISHGIDHHKRVWNYSKELLQSRLKEFHSSSPQLPEKLIIACYLHDIGMSIEAGVVHGKYSRSLCDRFLKANNLQTENYQDVLEAIEYHDKKDYTPGTFASEILSVLSVADDLDAVGFTGIFRYSEIYLLRGIKTEEIGHLVKANAARRFDNFKKTFGYDNDLVQMHEKRYKILDDYFDEYNRVVPSYKFGGDRPSGYCGIMEVLHYFVNEKMSFSDLFREVEKYKDDPVIVWYFTELEKEQKG